MEGNTITMQEIFSFQQKGIGPDGKVRGRFAFCGVRPKFIDKFRAAGIKVPPELFDPSKVLWKSERGRPGSMLAIGLVIFLFSLFVIELSFHAYRTIEYPDRAEIRKRMRSSDRGGACRKNRSISPRKGS